MELNTEECDADKLTDIAKIIKNSAVNYTENSIFRLLQAFHIIAKRIRQRGIK